ncbi:hypothetical protein EDB81DRAFT_698353 [Dactylonectria macrodidyma]|uniref:Rhodopsin domain-containing protein n=1 Tax=Dactylonectria macrodidyma TaxID=307937 RepID=A0A9P9DTT9_9HYPO|nr:hypothetical protein EDB81DRAFT_698353 [Dactylonectria macrodidyma]
MATISSTTASLQASAPTTSLATPLTTPQPVPPIGPPIGLFDHTGGRSEALFITAVVFPIVSAPIIILRLWASKAILKKWHTDDSTFVYCTLSCFTADLDSSNEARLGAGDHIITMTPEGIDLLLKVRKWAGVPLYNITTVFIKASVLMFYLRFSITTAFRIVTYAVMFVVIAYSIVNVAASFALNCANNAACDQLFRVYITCAAINVATDFAILLLPFWLLRPMKVRFARKVGIAFVLMAGGFVLGVSIYRLVITIMVDEVKDVTYGWGESVKWRHAVMIPSHVAQQLLTSCSLIESYSGLICASLPCLRAVFVRYAPKFPPWWRLSESRSSREPMSLATIQTGGVGPQGPTEMRETQQDKVPEA